MTNRGRIDNAQRSLAALQRVAVMIALGTGIALPMAKAETAPFSTVITPDMDAQTINRKIKDSPSNGAVYFTKGVYNLTSSLTLIGGRTYIGAGSQDPSTPSVLKLTAAVTNAGDPMPIFKVKGIVFSVTIEGLTFDAANQVNAKAIGGVDPAALLAIVTIRNNHFLSGLTECIDVPMILTWVDGNYFGERGSWVSNTHRHIHSVYPAAEDQTNANWVVNNVFSGAKGSESVLFEAGVQLNIRNNVFKNNDAATTLQISGMFQIMLAGNRFEGNRGDAIMRFANSRHSGLAGADGAYKNGNYIVRAEGNYYDMQRCATACTNLNKFIFLLDMNNDNGYLSKTQVYMGNESGTHFTHADGSLADLTDPSIAKACNGSTGIYLVVTGPFNMPDYKGVQTKGCPYTAPTGTNDSRFVIQSLSTTMAAGKLYNISLKFKNAGTTTWTAADGYKLVSQHPVDNNIWGISRVELPSSIAPGSEVTFAFTITAPATPGVYYFAWRMAQVQVLTGFGDGSPDMQITVTP